MSCLCKALCALCCGCACLIAAIIVGMVIWVCHLKPPSAGVVRVEFVNLNLTLPMSVGIDATVWIDNPNGWPMSGTIISAEADVFSLDKNNENESEQMFYIGKANLPNEVAITTHSNTSFHVSVEDELKKSDVPLAARLTSDCGPLTKEATTKVGINFTKAVVSFWKKKIELDDLGIFFNATIPCPKAATAKDSVMNKVTEELKNVHEKDVVVV